MAPAKRAQKRPVAKKTAAKKPAPAKKAPGKPAAPKQLSARKSAKPSRPRPGDDAVVYSDVRRELREGLVGRLLGR